MINKSWVEVHNALWESKQPYTESDLEDLMYSFHDAQTARLKQITKKRLVVLVATSLLTTYHATFSIDETGRSGLLFEGVAINAKDNRTTLRDFSYKTLTDCDAKFARYRFNAETLECLMRLLANALFLNVKRYITIVSEDSFSGEIDCVIKSAIDMFWRNL